MKMINGAGEAVYYNPVEKHGNVRFVVKAVSGQYIWGRDRQRANSRTFAQEHHAEAWLRRNGYEVK